MSLISVCVLTSIKYNENKVILNHERPIESICYFQKGIISINYLLLYLK